MNVIGHAADFEQHAAFVANDTADVSVQFINKMLADEWCGEISC